MGYKLEDGPLQQLLQTSKLHTLPKGQVLQLTSDRMLFNLVRTGYIKRYSITSDGSQSIQSVYGPGDIFPLTPVYKLIFDYDIYHGQEIFYYEAMDDTTVRSLDETTLLKALDENQMIYKDLLFVAGVRLGSNIQRLDNMSLKAANKQVANQLVHYAKKFGKQVDETIVIQAPLTHQNLASILNLARETVSHVLGRFQEKGLIKHGKLITVTDIERLRREAR